MKYGGCCAYCGVKLDFNKFHVDHIKPLHRGYSTEELSRMNIERGKNHISNYNPSCPSCNSSKSTYTLENWKTAIRNKVNGLRRDSSSFRILLRYNVVNVNNDKVKFHFEDYGK